VDAMPGKDGRQIQHGAPPMAEIILAGHEAALKEDRKSAEFVMLPEVFSPALVADLTTKPTGIDSVQRVHDGSPPAPIHPFATPMQADDTHIEPLLKDPFPLSPFGIEIREPAKALQLYRRTPADNGKQAIGPASAETSQNQARQITPGNEPRPAYPPAASANATSSRQTAIAHSNPTPLRHERPPWQEETATTPSSETGEKYPSARPGSLRNDHPSASTGTVEIPIRQDASMLNAAAPTASEKAFVATVAPAPIMTSPGPEAESGRVIETQFPARQADLEIQKENRPFTALNHSTFHRMNEFPRAAESGPVTETQFPDRRADLEIQRENRPSTEIKNPAFHHRHDPPRSSESGSLVEKQFSNHIADLESQKENRPHPAPHSSALHRMHEFPYSTDRAALTIKEVSVNAGQPQSANALKDHPAGKPQADGHADSTVELPQRAVTMKEWSHSFQTNTDAPRDRIKHAHSLRAQDPGEKSLFALRVEPITLAPENRSTQPVAMAENHIQSVIEQITEARQAMKSEFGRVRIVLNPPNLGTIDLEVVVRNERVEVVMTAENSSVQQALQSRAEDIRIALQRHDLKIEGFQVMLQDQEAGQRHSNGGALYEQRHEHRNKDFSENDNPVLSAIPATVLSRTGISGSMQYGLSIFA
jgi:flagellar hook-length control protein FliK